MTKRIFALLFVVVLIIGLVGCGSKKRQIIELTLSTEDAEAILAAAGIMLPAAEETAAAGTRVTYFYYYDDFHNYSDDEVVQTGYWTFKQKYNCDVDWIETTWSTLPSDLANLVVAGTSPDFTHAWAETFPMDFINGLYTNVDDYIDYDTPLWEGIKYFSDTFFSIGGKHYMFITDVQNNSMMLYNRRVFDEWGFDDPAELFYNDEWTWDRLMDMAKDFCDPDEGRYAFNGWHTDATFFSSTGTYLVELDPETGKFVANPDDPRLERAANWLSEVNKNDLAFPHWNNNWSLNYGDEGGGMKEGMTLFAMGPAYILDEITSLSEEEERFGDMGANEVMVVPVPRDPDGDGEYYIDSIPKGYLLVKNAPNPEGVALLAACDRFKTIDPTVIRIDKKQKMDVLKWNEEMMDMWDTMYGIAHSHNTVVQYEDLGDATTYVGNMTGLNSWDNPSTWAELKEANKDALQYAIDELNARFEEYNSSGGF